MLMKQRDPAQVLGQHNIILHYPYSLLVLYLRLPYRLYKKEKVCALESNLKGHFYFLG